MLGLMQQRPLLISSLLDYAERYHAGTEIVSRTVEGPIHRSNWGSIAARARQVASALRRLGVTQSERVATLAWNHSRHLEIYFGTTCSGGRSSPCVRRRSVCCPGEALPVTAPSERSRVSNTNVPPSRI